jgi:hypothetical protein
VPLDPDDPQAEPVFVIYPELSICRQLWPLVASSPGNRIAVVPVKLAYNGVVVPPP